MSRFAPILREHRFRVAVSLAAFAFIGFVMFGDGVPDWRWLEFAVYAGMFFAWLGGSSAYALWRAGQ
ncbi:hypothetical protein [Thalassobacter stenotrophicus]|jgi:hypothetical protein|uniref:Uncharacterized protein n=2 Tax=Thalassobacter stenotrophicus TaxID=266809 RepID=A0A0P1EXL2_9RHOB|nr:hypothetical protein [Thalassobacter stenotrophicus]PVZ49815.1 hypothetical protein DD557_14390 [Thalassobacter stenotrophicus]CUH59736.1 hypothetical protein THS5294_01023 [Thalassobacter stenotrophicus]SHI90329.1 hypothetical protein SAMN02744035_01976 [Thalassobacter stenotrophicus DSM 16310]